MFGFFLDYCALVYVFEYTAELIDTALNKWQLMSVDAKTDA